jgi:Fic family protein
VHRAEPAYHAALEYADRRGDAVGFIAYQLERIEEALAELLAARDPVSTASVRLSNFLVHRRRDAGHETPFRRKEYMDFHPWLSTATATRDLKEAVLRGLLLAEGAGRNARYRVP